MSSENKAALVPRLRFPEFQGAALRSVLLGDVTEEGRSRNGNKHSVDSVMGVTKAEGIVPMEARLIAADIARYKIVEKNWFAYNPMRLNIGSIARWNGEREILVSPDYVVFKCITNGGSGIEPVYFDQFRQTKAWEEFVTEGGDGSVRVRIYYKDIARIALVLPPRPEQQKIADCLSSLDELIAAQARKVDALKTHKKGLMQHLFPREGETQPRLRFPEFQNAGEWVVKPLGEIFPITSSKRVHESDWVPTGVPFYRAREIVALSRHESIQPLFISEELYAAHSKQTGEIRDGHLLVTGVGSIGVPYLVRVGDRFYFKDGNIIWLKNDGHELSGDFLLRLYETDYVQKQLKAMADVGTVATYTIDNAKRTLAAFPKDQNEQQRIADCLTSLDTLITAATQELETLKTHKKGLMQQLFPALDETPI